MFQLNFSSRVGQRASKESGSLACLLLFFLSRVLIVEEIDNRRVHLSFKSNSCISSVYPDELSNRCMHSVDPQEDAFTHASEAVSSLYLAPSLRNIDHLDEEWARARAALDQQVKPLAIG